MTKHLKRSRITKALTDSGLSASFPDAEARLDAVHVCVFIGSDQAGTPAGQAAALTAIATTFKCFGRVSFVMEAEGVPIIAPLPIGESLTEAAGRLGANVADASPAGVTHTVKIGTSRTQTNWSVQCWWDRWLAGTRAESPARLGDSRLPLAGVFAAALAIRQVFANIRVGASARAGDTTISLWEPWKEADLAALGPTKFIAPNTLWLLGLGHLGQAFVWNLALLPYRAARRAVLQDDQRINEENEATSLLVTGMEIGERKVRVANTWLEACGWNTELIERRHRADIALTTEDPPFLLCGLDSLAPRIAMSSVGFDYMIDAGIGHGPGNFEGIQIRIVPKGASVDGLWGRPATESPKEQLLSTEAYRALKATIGTCGAYMLADASVAVPFVGAATGALVVSQLIRLASMQPGVSLLQLELGAPGLVIDGGQTAPPQVNLGGEMIDLDAALASAA